MRRAQDAKDSEIRADDLQEVVVTADRDLRIVLWNRAGIDITGFSRERLAGKDLGEILDEESRERIGELTDILGRGGSVPGVELRLKTRYGHTVDVDVTGYAECVSGELAGFTFVMRDLTLRNVLEERRDRLERMFRTLVEHAPSVIYITDADGHIQFINTAVERILGYEPRELQGRDLMDIVHPDDRERAFWPLHERRTGQRATYGFRLRFLRKGGSTRSFETEGVVFSLNSVGLYFTPVRGRQELRFSGTEGMAQDVTEVEGLREFQASIRSLLPICSSCGKIRTQGESGDVWVSLGEYLRRNTGATLTHTYCPDCFRKIKS